MMVIPHHGSRRQRTQDTSMWLAVFDVRTFTRTGVELFVVDDNDATSQLGVLAPALELPQDAINIKPRPGWQGYGHPDLFPR
jgi:hypothetical protein